MQYQYMGYKIKGFYNAYNYAMKATIDTNDTIQYRIKVLEFWQKHGTDATKDAFDVSRRTLYYWNKKLQEGGIYALQPKSTAPKQKRSRNWDIRIIEEIRALRREYPNIGKAKLYPLIKKYCQSLNIDYPSSSTIGRIINDDNDKMRITPLHITSKGRIKQSRRHLFARKPKNYKAKYPGECAGLDTIERRLGSLKRYVMTFVDPVTSFAMAVGVTRNNSYNASKLFTVAQGCYMYPIHTVLTDNGSEFKGDFDRVLNAANINHWHTYPNTPKMNAHCERFNRTIQEEFIDYYEDLLFTDIELFNDKLANWLVWYNKERPHYAQGQLSPVQAMIKSEPRCKMYWAHTKT